jgi:hypothetical protein
VRVNATWLATTAITSLITFIVAIIRPSIFTLLNTANNLLTTPISAVSGGYTICPTTVN